MSILTRNPHAIEESQIISVLSYTSTSMEIKSFLLRAFLLLISSFLPYPTLPDSIRIPSRRFLRATTGTLDEQFLVPHNRARVKLGLHPLEWSEKLAEFANSWADQRKGDCAMVHSKSDYGENIFWGSGKEWSAADAVKAWASEKRFYDYKKNLCIGNRDCLHYTQVVWKESCKVGCARITCDSGDTFIMCNYDPHGNVIGQKPF